MRVPYAVTAPFGPTPGILYGEVEGLAYDPTSSEVLVSNSVWDNVSAISDATNNITGSFAVGTDPAGIAIDNRSGEVFVTDLGCRNGYGCVPGNVSVLASAAGSLETTLLVGSYPLGVAYIPSSGEVWVSNADQGTISILSYGLPPTTYAVTLTEQGLPSGTTWSGTLGGITLTSTTENLTFMEPNGTYSYTVEPVPGYFPSDVGVVQVNGGPVVANVAWLRTYPVWFNETGLPAGTDWSITLNGTAAG